MSDLPAAPQQPDEDASPPVHPALEEFKGLLNTPQAQDWADEATQKIQAFETVRSIADGAHAAANEYVNNLDQTKSQFVQMVHNDPTKLPLALDLAEGFIKSAVAEDQKEHVEPLTQHFRNQIAAAGIQSLAQIDEQSARVALDRYGEHLSDDDQGHLESFIGTMATARAADHEAQIVQEARAARLASDTLAHSYLGALSDPGTGDVAFPNNWLRDMIADPRLVPQTKAALAGAHERLLTQGDPMQSDPNTIITLLDRATSNSLTPTEVWSHAGADLSLADTQMLAGASFPKTPEQQREVAGFAQTLATARSILASPENGQAGQRAFGDFVNWLMPEYRRAGPGSLDPNSQNWIMGAPDGGPGAIAQFMPTGGDVLLNRRMMGTENTADRPSLGEIFGGSRMPTVAPNAGARPAPPRRQRI